MLRMRLYVLLVLTLYAGCCSKGFVVVNRPTICSKGHTLSSQVPSSLSAVLAQSSTEIVHLPCVGEHRSLGSERCRTFNSKYLSTPSKWYTSTLQYLTQIMCGTIFGFIMKIMNRFHPHRLATLHHLVYNRPSHKGLLTVCNHQSMADDPGLWSAMLPLWRTRPSKFRWSICTEDVFFSHPFLTSVLEICHVLPIDRKGSRDQPLFQRFFELIQTGHWGHIYLEGRVWQNWRFMKDEVHLGPIKTGIGKLIAHAYPNDPIVLPFYHRGMDGILPEIVLNEADQRLGLPSKPSVRFPRAGNSIHVYVGKPISFHEKLKKFEEDHPGLLSKSWYTTKETNDLYREISFEVENQMIELEHEAYNRSSPARKSFLSIRKHFH